MARETSKLRGRTVHDDTTDGAGSTGAAGIDHLPLAHAESGDGASLHSDGAGEGEMASLIRSKDWSHTSLGAVETWSQSLRMMVGFMLANRFPLLLWWGPDYASIYNDAYRPILGRKHPAALGQPVRECWSEIWHVLQPLIDTPFKGGPSTWMEDIELEINRHGYVEETHFTIAYSPVPDASAPRGIGGVLATVHEITEKVVAERRALVLRDLGARALVESRTPESACAAAASILSKHTRDVPFALLYLIEADGNRARLAGAAGVEPGHAISPLVLEIDGASPGSWPLHHALESKGVQVIEGLGDKFDRVPTGPWSDPPHSAVVATIPSNIANRPAGVLVAGVSARLAMDERYLGFLELLTAQIATAIANARAYEEERRRAEALAELDRAKTEFFSNVSHEFRTPLTLLLGPLEEVLNREDGAETRDQLERAHRNALRLLKLVNTLLDFSRIEAGRLRAAYEPTDLAEYTAQLASNFRAAIEAAGMRLVLDMPPLPKGLPPVYVDRDMWEKIVLNLLSNAFKHTFGGTIAVRVHARNGHACLEVADTGVGIPADQLPRVFDRFHRVPNVRSRTHEGTGIGLALVQELVKLHGGTIEVTSEEGSGSTFTVSLPFGDAHLPSSRDGVVPERHVTASDATAFVEEAMRWLPDAASESVVRSGEDAARVAGQLPETGARVLVVDDNADMRAYVTSLLGAHWNVETASDGASALTAVKARAPDLVLSDIMMPGLDGFGLLRELRAKPETREIPVILLSARAGEEARVDGLTAGADDYLVKPFTARELLARVGTTLHLSRVRKQAEAAAIAAREDAETARKQAEAANRTKSEFLAAMSHELRTPLNAIAGYVQLLEMGVHGAISEAQRAVLSRIQKSGQHLLSLINDILNFAKLEAGRVEYELSDVVLAEVLGDVLSMMESQLEAKELSCDLRVAPDLKVRADGEKLQQILLNLFSNAIKFTERGGRLTIDTATRKDDVDGAHSGFVFLRVADTGIGIPREKQLAIFDPFVQVHRHFNRVTEGTGLGLAISRDLARGMGGDLRVRSTEGTGSTFTLALPRA